MSDLGPPGSSSIPPTLDGDIFADTSSRETSTELPAYSRSATRPQEARPLTEHTFTLETSDRVPWLVLKVKSSAPSTKGLPVFVEGQPITGEVDLRLDKPENIKSVVVSIQGIVTVSYDIDERLFLNIQNILWDASAGQPSSSSFLRRSPNERLEGRHRWPFNISMPSSVNVTPRQARELQIGTTERLPPNMSGRGTHATINYQILVEVKRSGAFKATKRLSTLVGFSPLSRPDPPSPLRCRAYLENTIPLGPEIDPAGWTTFPEREQRGSLFKQRDVRIEFSGTNRAVLTRHPGKQGLSCMRNDEGGVLMLPLQLNYTRGTVVPCFMSIRSTDVQALDLLATPLAPQAVLRRKLKAIRLMATLPTAVPDDDFVDFGKASWQLQPSSAEGERQFYGEIVVPHTLTPSFTFGTFDLKTHFRASGSMQYFVEVHPFCATGFIPANEEPLFRTEVTISAINARGPRPRTYLPPGYTMPQGADGLSRRLHMLLEYTDSVTSIT